MFCFGGIVGRRERIKILINHGVRKIKSKMIINLLNIRISQISKGSISMKNGNNTLNYEKNLTKT